MTPPMQAAGAHAPARPQTQPVTAATDDHALWRTAWVEALAALEADVETAERFLTQDDLPAPAPWTPPQIHGPLPEDLLPRAQQLLDRQMATAKLISARLCDTGRQAALAGKLKTAYAPSPVYVDLQA
jgi:hypothetical protein